MSPEQKSSRLWVRPPRHQPVRAAIATVICLVCLAGCGAGQVGSAVRTEVPHEDTVGPIALRDLTGPLRAGVSIPVVVERGGPVRVDVPVATPGIPQPRAVS
jgi:hypothetical protein